MSIDCSLTLGFGVRPQFYSALELKTGVPPPIEILNIDKKCELQCRHFVTGGSLDDFDTEHAPTEDHVSMLSFVTPLA